MGRQGAVFLLTLVALVGPATSVGAKAVIRTPEGQVAQPYTGWMARSKMPLPASPLTIDNDMAACGEPSPPACVQTSYGFVHMNQDMEINRFDFYHELAHMVDFEKHITRSLSEGWADLYASCSLNAKRNPGYGDTASDKGHRRKCKRLKNLVR